MTAGRSKWWWGVDLKMEGLTPLKTTDFDLCNLLLFCLLQIFLLVYEHSMLPVLLHQVTQK